MALRVIELFAGVGGFRLALAPPQFKTVWSNQWEPGEKAQHASACYVRNFGADGHSNEDISTVDADAIPDHDLLVGGFPCQDYSVATTKAQGISGKKGVLWWEIERIVRAKKPSFILLENVDRLLRSPTKRRGRDFAIVLRCLNDLGYTVEWRAINAADYGFPQKRRRTFIFATRGTTEWGRFMREHAALPSYLQSLGFFGREFAVQQDAVVLAKEREPSIVLPADLQRISDKFSADFANAGVAIGGSVWTTRVVPVKEKSVTLGEILDVDVGDKYFVDDKDLPRWKYLKGGKAEKRKTKEGFEYAYTEGAIPFPDKLDQPARTILTHEGARSPSRFNHIILDPRSKRYRLLTPTEVEKLNGFPPAHTAGMPERRRYFCMGNALVVGLVARMGEALRATHRDPARGQRIALRRVRAPVLEQFAR